MTGPGYPTNPPSEPFQSPGYPQNPPSQPFQAQQYQPVAYQLPDAPQPPTDAPRKSKAVLVLSIVAVLLLGAAGTFGTLWFMERKDHKTATDQIITKDQELKTAKDASEKAKTSQASAETKLKDIEAKLAEAEKAKSAATACVDSAKKLKALVMTTMLSGAEGEKAVTELIVSC